MRCTLMRMHAQNLASWRISNASGRTSEYREAFWIVSSVIFDLEPAFALADLGGAGTLEKFLKLRYIPSHDLDEAQQRQLRLLEVTIPLTKNLILLPSETQSKCKS
jgi:hypothetical protein